MSSPYLALCATISREVAHYAKAGVVLSWGTASRNWGEAILRRGNVEARVLIARTPSRHDTESAVGRVRRALRTIGVQGVGSAPVAKAPPKKKPAKRKKRRLTRTHAHRIKQLEVALMAAVERIAALEAAMGPRAVA